MVENGMNGAKEAFASHWLTIQPSLFPEWEREMDRREAENELHRQAEAKSNRQTKRFSKAFVRTAQPRPPKVRAADAETPLNIHAL